MDTPLVSIICETYNQEAFISQCLDGLIMQQTTFPFEILVHDDASTDLTPHIIRRYANEYPEIIKPIYQSENIYSQGLCIWMNYQFPRVKGKYIAICEGDDYWTDPCKLQKQVTFLENNSDYALVYTRCMLYDETMKKMENRYFGSYITDFNHLLSGNEIPTLTVCIRNDVAQEYRKEIDPDKHAWLMGDYPLWLWVTYHHKIKFLEDITAVYRIQEESASHSGNNQKYEDFQLSVIDIMNYFIKHFNLFFNTTQLGRVNSLLYEIFARYRQSGNFPKARHYYENIDSRFLSVEKRRRLRRFRISYSVYMLKGLLGMSE